MTGRSNPEDQRGVGAAVRLGVLTAVLGVLSGLGAAGLTWIMHAFEELVYGHGEEHGRVLTEGVAPWRMSVGVAVVAVVLALAWWLLRGRAKPLVGIESMVRGEKAPVLPTIANAVFQMVGVGAGLPVGREVAPRELAALFADRLSFGVDRRTQRVLVAAAAGAGLGAVYQVPLAGAVFAMELLLAESSTRIAAICLAMSAIAVVSTRVYVSPVHQFAAPMLDAGDAKVWLWALVVGAVLGPFGGWFGDVADHVKARSQRGRLTLVTLPLAGLGTAALAWFFPQVLGNGRSAAQGAFLGMGVWLALILLVGKTVATMLTLRAGAVGGTLAPAIAAGALAGIVLGQAATAVVPGLTIGATSLAVLGAAAVLATSLRGPATGLLLVAGVTGQGHAAYAALALAVAAAYATSALRPAIPRVAKG